MDNNQRAVRYVILIEIDYLSESAYLDPMRNPVTNMNINPNLNYGKPQQYGQPQQQMPPQQFGNSQYNPNQGYNQQPYGQQPQQKGNSNIDFSLFSQQNQNYK